MQSPWPALKPARNDHFRMCTDLICDALEKGESLLPIIELWEQGAEEFKKAREKYLLY